MIVWVTWFIQNNYFCCGPSTELQAEFNPAIGFLWLEGRFDLQRALKVQICVCGCESRAGRLVFVPKVVTFLGTLPTCLLSWLRICACSLRGFFPMAKIDPSPRPLCRIVGPGDAPAIRPTWPLALWSLILNFRCPHLSPEVWKELLLPSDAWNATFTFHSLPPAWWGLFACLSLCSQFPLYFISSFGVVPVFIAHACCCKSSLRHYQARRLLGP